MLPGTISAASVTAPLQTSTPSHTLGSSATSAPAHMSSNALVPVAYWYGHADTKRNPLLLDRLIRNLGENVWDKLADDTQGSHLVAYKLILGSSIRHVAGRVSGCIIDTPSSFAAGSGNSEQHRQSLIKACVDAFRSMSPLPSTSAT